MRPAPERTGRFFGRDQFLDALAQHLQLPAGDAASLARAAFMALQGQMSREEIAMVEGELPMDLRDLWRPRLGA